MPDWTTIAIQVPGMSVLAAVVWFFLKHVRATGSDFRESLANQSKLVSSCVDRMVCTHERTIDSLDKNTEMFGRVETRLDQLTEIERRRLEKEVEKSAE